MSETSGEDSSAELLIATTKLHQKLVDEGAQIKSLHQDAQRLKGRLGDTSPAKKQFVELDALKTNLSIGKVQTATALKQLEQQLQEARDRSNGVKKLQIIPASLSTAISKYVRLALTSSRKRFSILVVCVAALVLLLRRTRANSTAVFS